MGGFTDQIITHRKEFKDLVFQMMSAFVALVLTMYAMDFFVYKKFRFLIFLLVVIVWYVAYRLLRARSIEYEYTILNHELIIDVIKGKRKRKNIVTVDIRRIEICAAVADEEKRRGRKKVSELEKRYDCTGDGQSGVYFIEYQGNKGTVRVLIQPEDEILDALAEINPRNVFKFTEE